MARFLKNPTIGDNPTNAVTLPVVPGSSAGDAPTTGLIRFNQSNSRIEFYYNGAWSQIAKIGSVQLVVDTFTGDGVTQAFVMSQTETDPSAVAVFIGGVYQQPIINYTVSGYGITFTSPPPSPDISPNTIIVIHNINSTNVAA